MLAWGRCGCVAPGIMWLAEVSAGSVGATKPREEGMVKIQYRGSGFLLISC